MKPFNKPGYTVSANRGSPIRDQDLRGQSPDRASLVPIGTLRRFAHSLMHHPDQRFVNNEV